MGQKELIGKPWSVFSHQKVVSLSLNYVLVGKCSDIYDIIGHLLQEICLLQSSFHTFLGK